ncbi:hypothetical protein Dimus_032099 [Dionaea muscipula]
MIYDVNSPLFRSFLSQKGGGSSDKRFSPPSPLEPSIVCFLAWITSSFLWVALLCFDLIDLFWNLFALPNCYYSQFECLHTRGLPPEETSSR